MATIATIAGVAITLPALLSGAWSTLKFAYDLYGQVDLRRTQLKLLLDRCSELILGITQCLPSPDTNIPTRTQESIAYLQTLSPPILANRHLLTIARQNPAVSAGCYSQAQEERLPLVHGKPG
jgi:hypothetical protein